MLVEEPATGSCRGAAVVGTKWRLSRRKLSTVHIVVVSIVLLVMVKKKL
jgi:hypothetical protein